MCEGTTGQTSGYAATQSSCRRDPRQQQYTSLLRIHVWLYLCKPPRAYTRSSVEPESTNKNFNPNASRDVSAQLPLKD
jgi:hypothetical protein